MSDENKQSVVLRWSETCEWRLEFTPQEWAALVAEMGSDLPASIDPDSVTAIRNWLRTPENRQECEELLTVLKSRPRADVMDSYTELDQLWYKSELPGMSAG